MATWPLVRSEEEDERDAQEGIYVVICGCKISLKKIDFKRMNRIFVNNGEKNTGNLKVGENKMTEFFVLYCSLECLCELPNNLDTLEKSESEGEEKCVLSKSSSTSEKKNSLRYNLKATKINNHNQIPTDKTVKHLGCQRR